MIGLRNSLPPRVVLRYYLYKGALSQGFIVPIVAEYVLWRGLSYGQLGLLGGAFMVAWVGSEIPTGYLADRFGRKRLLVASSAGTALVVGSLAVLHSFETFLAAYVAWAIAVSLRSGAGSAWLYELLRDRLDESEYARVTGNGRAVFLLVGAVTAIAGARLAAADWRYPFVANAILLAASVVAVATLPASGRFGGAASDAGDGADEPLPPTETIRRMGRVVFRTDLRWVVLYTALLFGFVEVAATFTQPVSTNLGVSIAGLGWLYAAFNLVSAGASAAAGWVEKAVGTPAYFAVAPVAVGLAFALLLVVPAIALPGFFLARGANSLAEPLRRQYVNDRIGSTARATGVSALTMVSGLVAAGTRIVGGQLATVLGPSTTLALLGGCLVGSSLLLLALVSPFDADCGIDRASAATDD